MSHSYRYRIIYTQKKQWLLGLINIKHESLNCQFRLSLKEFVLIKRTHLKAIDLEFLGPNCSSLFLCIRSMHFPFIMCLWITSFYSVKSVLLVTFFRHLHYLLRRQDHILRAESLSLILQSVLHRIHFDNNGSWKVIRSLIDKTDQSIEEYIKE